ncbi:MAG: hypothetical protein FWF24_02300 [Alphaproteobacteria bacterium]|nr:hypothetical protein [Alphaproteobacteria bacterium]
MDPVYQAIAAILFVGLVIMMGPRVLARNRGNILRNIAIWVGIFLFLALAYIVIQPEKRGSRAPIPSAPFEDKDTAQQPQEESSDLFTPKPSREEDGFSTAM